MRTTRLLSTIAATALLGVGAAAAQGMNGPVKPERAPAAQQNAPAEKIAPNIHAGERGSAETTGQGPTRTLHPGATGDTERNQEGTVGAAPQNEGGGTSGMKAEENGNTKSGAQVEKDEGRGSDQNAVNGESHTKQNAMGSKESPSSQSASEPTRHGETSTTGQGAAASAAKLSPELRTKITTIINKRKVEPAHLNVSVHVGVRIPASVHYYPLPPDVVEIYPEWRGYDYIVVSDEIVIIDPDDHAVVAILET